MFLWSGDIDRVAASRKGGPCDVILGHQMTKLLTPRHHYETESMCRTTESSTERADE